MDHNELLRHAGTGAALGATGLTAAGWLPAVPSMVLASIWWLIRICETRTVQGGLRNLWTAIKRLRKSR